MYPDVPDVLKALREKKKLKLAIVSTHPRSNLVKELEEYGIIDLFDEISGDPMQKTERLQLICKRFQIPVKESFFVEDSIYGLKSGHQAGVNCFGITTGYHSRERLEAEGTAVTVVDSLTELLEHV
jgi:phosphoglycolate phosphatase-like HAD superfamily hydrolase